MSSAGEIIARLENATKSFGDHRALENFSMGVERGEIVALLGPNGAGKTTVLSLLLGLRRPDSGSATLFGQDPSDPTARSGIGVTPQDSAFPLHLTIREVLSLVAAHYDNSIRLPEILSALDLEDLADRQTGGLSGGEKRRLALALAFIGRPEAVFLDEPTTGLDAAVRRRFWTYAQDYAQNGGTIFLTTHYLEEADALAHRVCLIDRGRLRHEGSVAEIKARVEIKKVRFRSPQKPELSGVEQAVSENGWHTLHTKDADELVKALVASGATFEELEVAPISLEEAILMLTGDGDGGPQT